MCRRIRHPVGIIRVYGLHPSCQIRDVSGFEGSSTSAERARRLRRESPLHGQLCGDVQAERGGFIALASYEGKVSKSLDLSQRVYDNLSTRIGKHTLLSPSEPILRGERQIISESHRLRARTCLTIE